MPGRCNEALCLAPPGFSGPGIQRVLWAKLIGPPRRCEWRCADSRSQSVERAHRIESMHLVPLWRGRRVRTFDDGAFLAARWPGAGRLGQRPRLKNNDSFLLSGLLAALGKRWRDD